VSNLTVAMPGIQLAIDSFNNVCYYK